jgi:hypothetical protein
MGPYNTDSGNHYINNHGQSYRILLNYFTFFTVQIFFYLGSQYSDQATQEVAADDFSIYELCTFTRALNRMSDFRLS